MSKVVFGDGSPTGRECVEVQARADAVYRQFGDSAPPPVQGEMLGTYYRRVLEPFGIKYNIDLSTCKDATCKLTLEKKPSP